MLTDGQEFAPRRTGISDRWLGGRPVKMANFDPGARPARAIMPGLSDATPCARWLENPHDQLFCSEACFRHERPFERSPMTRRRRRLGEEQLVALLQDSRLSIAHETGAVAGKDLERVAVDTAVRLKAIARPTGARLMRRALENPVESAERESVPLRQGYLRLAKRAAIMVGCL